MDAGGLALPDDLVSVRECAFLPRHALARQLSLRMSVLAMARCQTNRFRLEQDIASLKAMAKPVVP